MGALDNLIGVLGGAPAVELVPIKVLDCAGGGFWSSVISGIDHAITINADVINLSLGGSTAPNAARLAVQAAYNAGIVLVGAAGNSGNRFGLGSNVIFPAKYDEVIAVAATDEDNNRAIFNTLAASSTGEEVELAAPGLNVRSTFPGGGYVFFSGTSMAAPHVSALAALLIASNTLEDQNGDGLVNNVDVRLRMRNTAVDLGSPGRDTWYGYGLINAVAAVIPPSATNTPPVADAGGPYGGLQGQLVNFDGSGSSDADGDPLEYSWSFGDGGTATGVSPTHAYLDAGVFSVALTVRDGNGGVNTDTTTATITATNQPPVANAGPDQTVLSGEVVTLNGSGSFDSDGSIVSYRWDLGDGTVIFGAMVNHTYAAAGTYTATLMVTDNEGAVGQDTATITVSAVATQTMHVGDVTVVLRTLFRGWQTWAEGTVLVVDSAGAPLSGVSVRGRWSDAASGGGQLTTGADGRVTLRSPTLRRPDSGTTFRFTVLLLAKEDYTYDSSSNVESGGSVTVP